MSAREEEWPVPAGTNNIAKALAEAQAEMQNPGFDATNPHFRNKFATLAAVRNAVIPVLAKHGIAVCQDISSVEAGVSCQTVLLHASGQQLRFGPLVLPVSKNDAQGFGSAATYARRYSLMAVACVVGDDDDDANAATGKPAPANQAYKEPITPRGDMTKNVPEEAAFAAAVGMREILEEDVDEDVKCLHVADRTAMLNKNQELFIAASDKLKPAERSAWKAYVKMAKDKANAEPPGRRF